MRLLTAIILFGLLPFQTGIRAESDKSQNVTLTDLGSAGVGKPEVVVDNQESFARGSSGDAIFPFHITATTGARPWNTPAGMIRLKVGKTLRIFNDDNSIHQLHTDGFVCLNATKFMAPGESYDCLLTQPYDPNMSGPLYNSMYGPLSSFWIEVSK